MSQDIKEIIQYSDEEFERYIGGLFSVDFKDKDGKTPIYYALKDGDINKVKILIKYKSDVNQKIEEVVYEKMTDEYSKKWYVTTSLLFIAVENNNYDIAKLLIENNADVNFLKNEGWADSMCGELVITTILHRAIRNENYEILKLLLDNKADPSMDSEMSGAYGWAGGGSCISKTIDLLKNCKNISIVELFNKNSF